MRLKNKNMENQMNLQFENINNALPGAEQIDFNPPQAWYDSPDIPDFTPGLDPDYVKLLDHYQPIIEQYTIPFADDINSVYPNENNDTNPSGDPYKNSFDRIFNDPIPQTNEVSIADPIVFSAKKTQFDRYYNHRNFSKLGFHPYANNEDYYNANSTFFSDAARMLTQFAKLTGSSIRGNYRSFGDMFNSDPYTIPDVQTSDEFEKAMGIGMSSRGGLVGFSNNLFLNFGYTFGIIASIAAEELLLAGLTAATGGGAAPLAAAKTTANVGKAAKVVGKSVSNTFSMGRMANATRQLTQTLNQTDNARTFWQATKSGEWGLLGTLFLPETMAAVKKLQTAKTAGKSLSDIAKMSTMFGGFYREIRAINYAMSESKLESGFVLNQQIANGIVIEEQKKLKGLEPNLTLVGENAQKAAFSTTMMNFGLIYMTNKLILDTAFKGFNQTLTRNLNNSIEGVAGRVIRQNNIIGPDGKIIRDVYSDAGKGLRSTVNRIKATGAKGVSYATLNSSLRYFAANLGEGVQELGQEAISHGTKYYFSKLQENPLSGGADLYKASINKAVSSQVSGQGIETFLSGFLMGGLAKGPQKLIFEVLPNLKNRVLNTEEYKAYQEQKEKAVKELVEERNKSWNQFADDPIAYLEKHKNDFLIQNEVNSEMNEASYDGDTFKFIDAKDFGKFHHIYGLMQSGTVDLFKAELQDFLNLTDEELNEAFPTFKEEIKQGKLKQRVNDLIELVNKSESAYNKNKDVLVNPYDYNKYKKDTPEYRNELIKYSAFEHIRYLQMFTEDSFNRALERADKIYNELASDPILKKIQANDLTVLLDENSIKSEINLLKIEIENLDDSEESKKLKQEKQTKIEKLKKVSEVLNLKDNLKKDGSFDNRKVKNILEPLKEYVQFLADTRNDFADPNRIKDVLKKITDHRALNKRAKANNRALQYLAVPENFDRVLERQIGINKNLFENNKKNVEDRIKKYIGVIEKNNLLNGLADLGVYPDAMEVEIFLIFNDTSILKTFYHEDGIVTKDSENLYKKIQNLIEVYNNISKDVTQEEESVTEPVENTTVKQEQKIEEGEKLDYDFVIELNKLSDNYHPVLKETLYRVYKESLNIASNANQNPQTLSEWQKTDLALNIIDTYKFLKSKWKETLSKNTADKSTIEGNFIKDVGLKDWLSFDTTKEDPDILNKNKENNTNILLYLDTPEVSYEEADVLKVLIKHKSDNYIVRILKTFANGGYINNYKIITKTGLELSDQLLSDSTIFNENGAIFSSLEDAKKAVEKLENKYHNNNLPVDFQYGGVTLFQGAYIFSGEKRFQVLSTPEKIKASNTLEIVSEDSEVITINSPEEFKKNYSIDKLDPIVKSDKVSRIRINDPIRYIPHENENETREEAVQRLDYIFSNLTPEQRKGLELVILENPESGTITEKEFTFTGKQPNSQLSRVSDKYIISIRIADTVLRNEINAELNNSNFNISDSTEGIIAYLPNKNFIVYDAEGNVIDPRDIDLFTARNIFYKYNEEIDNADLEKIKENFAIQANLIGLVESKKSSSSLRNQKADIERRRQEELEALPFDEDTLRELEAIKKKDKARYARVLRNKAQKLGAIGTDILERHNAEDALESSNDIATRIAAKLNIEQNKPFNDASISDVNVTVNKIKKGEILLGEQESIKKLYDVELAALEDTTKETKTEGPLIITPEELENAGFYFNMTSRFFENEKESISPNSLDYNTIDGENIVIYDNRKQFFTNKKGREFRRRKKTLSTIKFENGVNPASRHKEIEKELGKKLHEVARNKGAYVLVVKNKSDEYTLVELKPRKLDVDEFVSFVDTLIEQSEKTVNENLIEDTKKTAEKQDLRNSAYNVKFNDEQINNKIYIISKPDTIISLELDPRGRIEIQVLKYDNKTKKYEKQLKNKRGQNSAERIGFNELIGAQEKIDTGKDKYNVYYDLFQTHFNNVNKRLKELGINVNITVDDIRKNISDEATVEEILNNTETNHSREVRKEYQITISQNDVDIQATKDVPLIVEAERKKRDSIEKEKSEVEIDEKASEEEVAELFGNLAEKIININNEIEDILTKERDTLTDKEVKFYEENGKVIKNFLNEKFLDVSNLTKEYVDELSKEVDLISEQYRKEEKKLKSNELKEDEGIQETPPTQESGISVEEYLDKDTLNKKISELESKIKEKQKELIEKASSEGDITILNNNEELNNLKEELNGLLDKITSNKILKGVVLDEIDVENINVFLDWAAKNLPDYIDIKDLAVLGNNMKSGGVRVGAFALALSDIAGGMRVKGTLYTGAETPFRYHEAFHAIFRLLLTDEQQSKYLRLAAKEVRAKLRKEGVSFEKALNDFKNLTSEYQDLSRSDLVKLYYEEYLADQFELFKQSPTSTKTNPANKSFFARLIEWIKSFFSRFTKNELRRLYENIDSGKFKSSTPVVNRFTLAAEQGVTVEANALIPYEEINKKKKLYKTLDADAANAMIRSIAATYLQREEAFRISKVNYKDDDFEEKTRNEILDEVIKDYKELYNFTKPFNQDLSLELKIIMNDFYSAFLLFKDEIKEAVTTYLSLVDVKIDDSIYTYEEQEDDEGLRTVSDWDKDASNYGGWNSISSMLRKFIMTTTVEESNMFNHEEVKEGEKLIVPVDFAYAYNGILKATANTTNPTEILNKLLLFSEHNPHTRAVVNRIFNRLGITEEDVTNGDWASKTKDPFFLNALLSGLENFRVDYLFIHRNNDGEVYVYSASQRDDANTQIDTWGQAYINIYKKYQDKVKDVDGVLLKEKAIDFLNYFESYVSGNYIKSISDVELAEAAKELRADLMKYTGVILSSQYLAYTILQNTEIKTQKQLTLLEAYSNVESLTSTNIQYMITAIDADRSIFSTDDLGSGRILKKISMANAEFDETIGASVFKNPNGDLVYAHQKSSFHLKTMILLNNQDTLDELKKDEFLTKNWLLNNEAFYELARNKGLKVTRISGFKQGRINQTEEGIEESGSIGKTYGDLTPREFLNVLINSYPGLFNKYTGKLANTVIIENENNEKEEVALAPILIRVLESSNTGDLTYLPVIKAVEYNKQGVPVLTEKALQGFINNIISEFERVKKNVNPETRDQRDIKNYNDGKKRAQKFGKNRYILTPITQKNNIITKKSNLKTSEKQLLNLKAGNQRILIYDNKTASKVLKYTTAKEERDVVISSANKKSNSKPLETKIVSLGRISIKEPSTFSYYVDLFGNSVVTQENKKKLTGSTIHSIKFGNTTRYTHSRAIADFLQGEAMYVYMTKEEYAKQEQDIVNDQQTSTETQQTEQFYEGNIELEPNTVFVFGSNPEGRHGAGAAKIARKQFGAIYGQGEGLQGNAYALPTKDLRVKKNKGYKSISPEKIIDSIKKLYETAKQNSDKQFKVAYRNTTKKSLNGYTGLEMIEMFNAAGTIPSNVIFSKEWFDTGKLNIKDDQKQVFQTQIASTIFELMPDITEEKIDEIYNNYVSLMNIARENKEMPIETFKTLLETYQVFNYKDTFIFGQYDAENGVFITRVNSSPNSKELLAEALTRLVKQGIDFVSFVPKDVADKYKRSGYKVSNSSFPYNFKGELMDKFMAVSNPTIANKVFNKNLDEVTEQDIKEYNKKLDLKYVPVEVSGDLIKKAGKEVSQVFETYLNQFGIVVKDIDKIKDNLGIDELGFADILSKIAYVKDRKDLPPVAGEFIAYMMQYNPLVSDIIKELSQTEDYKGLDKSEYFKIIGELIAKDLQNKLEGNYSKSLIDKIKELINIFFNKIFNTPVDLINKNIGIISNNVLQQNKKLITASLYKPGAYGKKTKQVSLQDALDSDKFGASIIDKLSKKGFILTGSTSLGEQGTIQRPDENLLHDIDWVSPFNREETKNLFLESYPDAIKIRDIVNEEYVTDTWIISPEGYKIQDLVKEGDKSVVTSYNLVDNSGKVAGTYKLERDEKTGKNVEIATGIEAKVIDFFSYENYNKRDPFEKGGVKLSNWKDIFKAKLQFARYKDVWDYNRFIPNENKQFLERQKTEENVSFEDYVDTDQETEIAADPKMLRDWATEIETIITENNDLSFEEVIEELGGMEEFKAFLTNRLEKEFEKFLNEMSQISANNLSSPYVMQGLKNADGNKTNEVNLSNNLLNLTDDFNYNLKQIFFNDWLNTSALNQILLGDRALILKDSTDEIKRAKSSNASGDTAATAATAEEFGIMHETKHISLFAFDDPINSKSYGEGSNVEIADGQTFGTIKAFKHFWFGLGKLTPKQARLLQRIERGEKISHSEIFNSAEGGKSYAKMQAMLNSKKFVYDDGMIYDKTSIFFLTKEYTSLYIDGKWVPKPNRIALHNLRESMEKFEEKEWSEGRGTLALAAPTSALKKLKMNVQKFEDATSGKEFLVDNRMDMDANYMRLQTINPSNKIEITDPNQVKSLITAEQKPDTEVIIDGKSFTIKEITDAYNNILKNRDLLNYTNKRNLIFSFDLDKANQLLDKSKKANSLQPELYSFLMYAASALKASNAVSNIIEMFSVDENGQQKYNLNNPQTVLKFEQLFLSFFAKGAMSSKIPGVSLALVSDMGVRVYRKVYSVDENGMPDKQEIIRENTFHRKYDPSVIEYNIDDGPNQGDDANLKNLAKAIENSKEGYIIIVDRLRSNLKEYDKNGKYTGQRYTELIMPTHDIKVGENIENVNRNIPKFISKMFAVRIPSQDKHSFMNIKWVDFMPNYYGSSAVVARELIEISGADFDIDKLYVHIKEWFYEGGLFYEYGNVDNDQEGYKHYIKSVSKKVKKQGSIYAAAVDKFNKKNPSGLTNNVLEYVNSKNISKDVAKAVIQLGLPLTYNDYISYRNQYEEEPYPEAMNNKILDYKYALLGNEHIAATENRNVAIHHEPADTDPLTDLLNELSETIPYFENLNIEEDVDIDNLMNKMKAFEANKAGANSIGAVVLPNLYLSLLKEYKISLPVIRDEKSGELLTKNLVLNDTLYKDFGGEYAGVDVKGEPYRKQYLISALITAMTDNAKLRLSAKLGLNKDALAVVANMVALGVTLKTSILLINNPLIQELYFRAINKEAPTDPGIKKLTEVQLGLLSDLFDRSVNKKNIPLVTNVNDDLLEYLIQANMNSKNLIENFESEKDPELISAAYSVLEQFYTALQIKNYTGHLGSVLSHTKGPGKRYTDVLRKEKDAESLGLHLTNSEYRDYTNSRIKNGEVVIDVRPILKNTWQGSMHDIFVEIKDKLLPRVFLTRTEMFMNMYNKFIKNIDSRQVSDEDLEKFRLDLLSYLTIKAYMQHLELSGSNMIGSLSNSILYPQLEGKKITELISNLREKDSNNFFLKYFVIAYEANDENNNYGINAAMANTFVKLNDSAKLKIQSDLVKLYMDPYSRDSVIELIHYIMVKDGMSYNYGTLLDAVTPFIYERYLEQIKGVENAFLNYNETNIINTFGVDMDTLTKDFIMGYLQSNKMRFKLKNFLAGLVTIKSDINSVREFTLKDVQENPDTLYIYADPNLNAKFGIMTNVLRIPYRRNSNNKELISDDYIGKFKEEFLKFIKNNDKIKKYKKIIYLDNLIPDYKLLKQKSPKIAEAMSDILRQINIDLDKNLGSRYVYVYNTPVTNKLIIDLYPEKNTEIGSVKGYGSERKGLKLTGKKLEAKNRKINKSLIKANIKINNLEFVSYGNKNTGEVFEIEIPYVLKVGDSITERYTHFKLVSYSTSKKAKDKNEDFITANYAEYEEFQPEGAFSQWSGGFMFGERPSGKEIKDFIENKNGEEYLDFDEPDFDLDDIDALIDSIPQEIIDQKAQSVSEKNPEEESDIIDFDDVDIDVEAPSDVFIKTLKAKNKIKGFLNELTPEQIKKLNKTAEDLFQEFNNTSVTIEEFIENLKNCHI